MATMKNAEEVMQILERFTRLKQKEIPKELDEYLGYVAKTGDTVFKWSSLKYLFREKLLSVIKNFLDNTPRSYQIPHYPNVDPFDYEDKKSSLVERLELFNAAPFTIQRLCELLIDPYRHYNRIDKFMRALEKTIFVISTIEPGCKYTEIENNDSLDSAVKGNLSLDVNVDIDIATESLSTMETAQNAQSSNGSNNKSDVEEKKGTEDKSNDNSESSFNVSHGPDDNILINLNKGKLNLPEEEEVELEKQLQEKHLENHKMLTGKTEEIKRSVDTTVSNKGGNMILTKIGAEIAKKGEMTVEEKEQDDVKGRNTEQQDPIKCQEDVEITQEITIKTLDKKETNRIDVVEQTAKEKNKVLSTTTEQQTKEETKEKEITIETIEKLAESNIPEEQANNIKESVTATIKGEEIAIASITTIETTVLPSLTLNDHPMIEDSAVEKVLPTLEEEVMAETPYLTDERTIEDFLKTTNDTTILGVNMERTITEDEPTGMEVDDTSQEAMDQ